MAETAAKLPTWYRVLATIVGLMAIVSAVIVLADPVLAVWLLIFILAFGLLFMGMDRLVIGISGQPLGWVGPMGPPNPSAPTVGTTVSTSVPKP